MWYIYAMEYYSTIKKNEIMLFVTTWMDLKIIILSEVSQMEKDTYHMIPPICGIEKKGSHELIYKTEIGSEPWKTNLRLPRGKEGRDKLEV